MTNDALIQFGLYAVRARDNSRSFKPTLGAWSEGLLGDKIFQQVKEEFAEIVIPNVWQREDKKVLRVLSRLSMSPKKVRRILRNVGLLQWSDNG